METRGRTQDVNCDESRDGNENSSGDENGDEDGSGDKDGSGDEIKDGIGEGGGEAMERKKPLHTVPYCPSLVREAVQYLRHRRGVRRIAKKVSTTGTR